MLTWWFTLLTFGAGVLFVALYGLTVSGHFPRDGRDGALSSGSEVAALWGTISLAIACTVAIASLGWQALPWYALALAGGGAVLFAPLLLQPLPDSIVDGPAGLVAFSGAAAAAAVILWMLPRA
jgi:hypothetical protein